MAKKKRGEAHGGGHGWFVTFADLMGLLMSFFVMLVAFSTQDNKKLQDRRRLDARRVRRADRGALFRHHRIRRPADAAEAEERRPHFAGGSLRHADPGREGPHQRNPAPSCKVDREFALASASLRQALQDMPELTEMSKHIMFEETKQGLNLEIVDQDGRSMFADGSKVPYDRTRRLIQKLAGAAEGDAAAGLDHRPHRGRLRAGAQRLRRVRSVGRPRQRGAPDSRARGPAAVPHLRGRRQGRQPAAVSRRSDAAPPTAA